MSDNVEKKVFILSIGFLLLLVVFTYGVLVGAYKYWPFDTFSQIKSLARTFTETGTLTPDDLLVSPAKGAPRERITFPDYPQTSASLRSLFGMGGVRTAT
jgi:hypothetical protein